MTKSFGKFFLAAALLYWAQVLGRGETASNSIISGMWVWATESYQTGAERSHLIKFCQDHQFNHLDVHFRDEQEGGRVELTDQKELAELAKLAGKENVSISALRGSQTMFFETNHARTLRELEAIIEFNNRLPQGSRLKGIKYDVEPQTLNEWRQGGPVREKIMRDYLLCLGKIHKALEHSGTKSSRMDLTVDVPFWWDKEDLAIEFDGHKKLFSQHVQDLTDSVTLMSYRRDPEVVKEIVKHWGEYAAKIDKKVLPSLLHSRARDPAESAISFYGLPTSEYLRVRRELETWAATQPGIGGIMHHHYTSLNASLDESDPSHATGGGPSVGKGAGGG